MGITLGSGNNTVSVTGSSQTVDGVVSAYSSVGNVSLAAGDDSLVMTSTTVGGSIDSGSNNDSITLTSVNVTGNLFLDTGNDRLVISQSTIDQAISGAAGNDTISLSTVSSINAIGLGSGNDSLTATSINVSSSINAGTGSSTIGVANSTIGGSFIYVDNDSLATASVTLSNTSIGGVIDDFTAGSVAFLSLDSVTVSGNSGGQGILTDNMQAGSSITLNASSVQQGIFTSTVGDLLSVTGSTVNGAINTQSGNDTVILNTVVSLNDVLLGAGADTLNATAITVSGDVDAGSGNSAITITSSTIGSDVLYTNSDTTANATLVLNNSSVGGAVDDSGNSSIVNVNITNSTISGSINGSAIRANDGVQASVAVANSTLTFGILTGGGNDTISLTGNTIGASIGSGSGNDRVFIDTRNVLAGVVTGGDGTDTLILQGTSLGKDFSISLSAAATLNDLSTTTLITETNYSLVTGFNGGAITGTVSLGASGDTFAVNSFETLERIVCFARGTKIRVAGGRDVAVETLRIGDLVETMDAGLQPVSWIGMRKFRAEDLAAIPLLRPIRISAGALGRRLPDRDLIVSPQHRMLVSGKIVKRMFDVDEALVAAKQLLDMDGIDRLGDDLGVDYFHVMFDRHQIIFAEGAPTESFFVGEEAVAALDADMRNEVLAIFPDLDASQLDQGMSPARLMISGRRARTFAARCVANRRELLEQ